MRKLRDRLGDVSGLGGREERQLKFSFISAKCPSIGHLCRDNAVIEKLSIGRVLGIVNQNNTSINDISNATFIFHTLAVYLDECRVAVDTSLPINIRPALKATH